MHSFHLLTYHAKRFSLVLVQESRLLARSGNECFVNAMDGKVNKERRACQLLLFASGFQNVLKVHIVPNTQVTRVSDNIKTSFREIDRRIDEHETHQQSSRNWIFA